MKKADAKRKAKIELDDFNYDMRQAGILCHIIKTTFDRSEETEKLALLRLIKERWGSRYLPL